MTPKFAEDFSMFMGCPAEKDKLPVDFLEEAKRPPPLYFETDERTVQGVCCVCYKKGVLGRCPNPSCGLLMHLTCVPSTEVGASQQCPVCSREVQLQKETEDKPYWHESELGAKL